MSGQSQFSTDKPAKWRIWPLISTLVLTLLFWLHKSSWFHRSIVLSSNLKGEPSLQFMSMQQTTLDDKIDGVYTRWVCPNAVNCKIHTLYHIAMFYSGAVVLLWLAILYQPLSLGVWTSGPSLLCSWPLQVACKGIAGSPTEELMQSQRAKTLFDNSRKNWGHSNCGL